MTFVIKMKRIAALLILGISALAADNIIFDTDCGFFGDDGSALTMLLRRPERVKIEQIAIVTGNVWAADSLGYVDAILKLLGRSEIRSSIGAQLPLVHTPSMAKLESGLEFQGAFADPVHLSPPASPSALARMAEAIRNNPGRITILALGPMTNIAMLLRLHPDLETKIQRIVFMGGNVHVPGNASPAAEFNFWFDPEAAGIVLRSRIPEKIMFPLDICNRAVLRKSMFDEIVAVKTLITDRYREDFGQRYPAFLKKPEATGYLWDELAALYLLDPEFVTKSEVLHLDVDTRFGKTYGATIPLDTNFAPEATPVRVMLDMNLPRMFAEYKKLLTQ